jgi:hypothetical protein
MAYRAWYERPAIVVLAERLEKTVLVPDEDPVYIATVDKRKDCYPPDGKGEIEWRLWTFRKDGQITFVTLPERNLARAVPGRLDPITRIIDIPRLPSGRYAIQFRGTYNCLHARQPQIIDGGVMRFDVI